MEQIGKGFRILIACEESDEVRGRFEKLGFDAWSCDLQPNRNPNAKHYQQDIFKVINYGWDAMIAFPPCTYLTVTANKWLKDQPLRKSGKLVGEERRMAKEAAARFFISLYNAPIPKIAIENPIGCMSSLFRKPDQIIHPYYFGDPVSKATCLWLKELPKLTWLKKDNLFEKSTAVDPEYITTSTGKRFDKWFMYEAAKIKDLNARSKFRSKTFPGIADAMATQWGKFIAGI